jgi:uncharacterized protein with HEPN domain
MLDSADAILHFIENKTRRHFDRDRMLSNAVIRELEVLGGAANHVYKNTQKLFSEVPWRQIIAMRNMLIHILF